MSKTGKNSNYAHGVAAENNVAQQYQNNGYNVTISPGSRGAADLKCTKGNKTHFVQVKSSHSYDPYISNKEQGNLKSTATRNGATAVVAKVTPQGSSIYYAKTGGKVKF